MLKGPISESLLLEQAGGGPSSIAEWALVFTIFRWVGVLVILIFAGLYGITISHLKFTSVFNISFMIIAPVH